MHHLILPKKEGFETDHINGNKLDNRIQNLKLMSGNKHFSLHAIEKHNQYGNRFNSSFR